MAKQVDKQHYEFFKYSHINRWSSYWHQINETLALEPKTVLEVGPGMGIYKFSLESENIKYYSVDVAKDLNPDFVSDLRKLDLKKKFDVVVAFEVLEHMPYKDFDINLKKLSQHAGKNVLISLPYFGPYLKLRFALSPFFDLYFVKKIFFPKKLKNHKEHFWELGRKGFPLRRIIKDVEKYFNIEKRFLVKENPYHYFFVLSKK